MACHRLQNCRGLPKIAKARSCTTVRNSKDILEQSPHQKYTTCWVFRHFVICCICVFVYLSIISVLISWTKSFQKICNLCGLKHCKVEMSPMRDGQTITGKDRATQPEALSPAKMGFAVEEKVMEWPI